MYVVNTAICTYIDMIPVLHHEDISLVYNQKLYRVEKVIVSFFITEIEGKQQHCIL